MKTPHGVPLPPASPASASHAPSARTVYLTGIGLGLVGSVLFSGKAIIAKLAYVHQVDPVTLIALRMVFSLPAFALVAWWIGRGDASRWRRGDWPRIVGIGLVGYYLASLLDFAGLQYISAGLERIILYLNPTLVLLLSAVWLRRPIGRRDWAAVAIAYVGVLFVFWHDLRLAGDNVPLGSLLVFLGALAYAVYLIAAGEIVGRLGSIRVTAYAMLVSSAACILHALVSDAQALVSQPAPVYWLSVLNAALCTVLPVFLVMMSVERVGAAVTSQTGMVGPVSTIAGGALLLGEPVSGAQMVGTAIVMTGIFVLTARRT